MREKLIFYVVYISQLFFSVLNSMSSVGARLKKIFYEDMMSLWGFRHVSSGVHTILDPIFGFLKSIGVSIYALHQFEGGFLSILIFVVAAVLGNFVGIEWYVMHLFECFVGVALLANVFQAVLNNIGELTLLSIFATCFILVFNIISLNTYAPVLYEDKLPSESC